MLDDNGNQFGIHLAQDAPGLGAAPLVDAIVVFPQLKDELDLPAGAGHDQRLVQGEQLGGGVGGEDRPVSQSELGGTDADLGAGLPSSFAYGAGQRPLAGRGWPTVERADVLGPQFDRNVYLWTALCRQPSEQIPASPTGIKHRRLAVHARQPETTGSAHRF